MKKIIISSFLSLVVAVIGMFLVFNYISDQDQLEGVIVKEITSDILDETRRVLIHLPLNYKFDSLKRYPVMYVLDGSSQDFQTANKFEILSTVKMCPEAIVVGIPNVHGKRSRDLTPHYLKVDLDDKNSPMGQGDKFLSFIEREVIPFVQENFRTMNYRMISGNSRGGLLVLYSLLEKPDLFDARFCYSPAFWREDKLIVHKAKDFFAEQDSLKSFLFMSLGEAENSKMKGGYTAMIHLLEQQAPKGLIWEANYTSNASHRNNSYISTSTALHKWGDHLKNNESID